jgi:hypothetical protein
MDNFDHEFYINNNPDLRKARINTREKAIDHYLRFGQYENRLIKKIDNHNKYYFSILMMFKNEESILKEWLEYYLLLGTDHFFLFNHGSTDKSVDILTPYIEKGLVTLNNFTRPFSEIKVMLNTGLNIARNKTKWLAIIDSDEFIVPIQHNNIKDFLRQYEPFGGVCINWQMFGTSNVAKVPTNKTMIETLTLKAHPSTPPNIMVKSIVQPAKVEAVKDQHKCRYKNNYFDVNTNKEKITKDKKKKILLNQAQINHYYTRDIDYMQTKAQRRVITAGTPLEVTMSMYNIFNDVQDNNILRFVPQLRSKLELDKDPAISS